MSSETRGTDSNPAKNTDDKDAEDEEKKRDRGDNEQLDFYSAKFDPLLALQCKDLKPPVENAKLFDNLAKFDTHLKKQQQDGATDTATDSRSKPGSSKNQQVVTFERRFEPHQMPVKSDKVRKPLQNVWTRMKSHDGNEGVFGVLERARNQSLQIKVITRHSHGIRGVCIATITAFDKYWNMTLNDVDEYWIRKRKPRVSAIGNPMKKDLSRYFPKITTINVDDVDDSKTDVISRDVCTLKKMLQSNTYGMNNKNSELCHRRINELLVRGEQVVFIAIAQGRQS